MVPTRFLYRSPQQQSCHAGRVQGGLAGTQGTFEVLQAHFLLPIKQAAEALGIGVTVLKRLCRLYNIRRWPQRKLASLDKLIRRESVRSFRLVAAAAHAKHGTCTPLAVQCDACLCKSVRVNLVCLCCVWS